MFMLTQIFGECSQVKLVDFLVAHPWSEFSKTELADGAQIARPTVYKLLDKLLKESLIVETKKVGNIQLYQTNRNSNVIKYISSLQGLLSDMEVEKQKKQSQKPSINIKEEKLNKLLDLEEEMVNDESTTSKAPHKVK